ncbi:hypothetical protein B0I33_1073 [Prauserella shujinwangii]|uniref:Uncharacterized protein n=1 Tax=Prauserella shujinwangii TaxID=1453103 RepID=A0A2T0LRZ3_9PSEU|nr:hypothetical protein [Prauserella shujinwangii]PRX46426.1 hypothetical protein B0I33_1073 [Prauserella shujinwangii]
MRTWKQFLKSLADKPRGFNADGRMVGVGLATAQDQARQRATAEVEDFLRGRAAEPRRTTTSS